MPKSSSRSRRSSRPAPTEGAGSEPEFEGYTWERMKRWARTCSIHAVRNWVVAARVKNWSEYDDFGQSFFENIATYGEIGTHRASLKTLHEIMNDMMTGWDPETQEETCRLIENEMRQALQQAVRGSYKARRVT